MIVEVRKLRTLYKSDLEKKQTEIESYKEAKQKEQEAERNDKLRA